MSSSLLTKQAIADALMELMQTKAIDKITVKDISERCSITRQTFYYHFQDIMDVVEWTLQEQMKVMMEESLALDSPQELLKVMIREVRKHPDVIRKLMQSQKREQAERTLLESIRACMEDLIEKKNLLQNATRADMGITLDFYSYALVGVLLDFSQKRNLDLDLAADQIYRLLSGKMFENEEL